MVAKYTTGTIAKTTRLTHVTFSSYGIAASLVAGRPRGAGLP